jgi:hypothetical protein
MSSPNHEQGKLDIEAVPSAAKALGQKTKVAEDAA